MESSLFTEEENAFLKREIELFNKRSVKAAEVIYERGIL